MKKILTLGTIGHVGTGKPCLTQTLIDRVKAEDSEIEVVDLSEEINAIEDSTKRIGSQFDSEPYLIIKAMPKEIFTMDYEKRERQLDQRININREYKLIKEKKSKLSRWERDKIVQLMESK